MKLLFEKPTSVSPCTQQDIETIVELAIELGVPVNRFTKRDYKTADHAYISWLIDSGGICRTTKNCSNIVPFSKFIARMHEWAAKNNPKAEQWQPKRGDWVEVSDNNTDWVKRIFLAEIKGVLYPIRVLNEGCEKAFESDKYITESGFKYMREIKKLAQYKAKIAELVAELNALINEE